MVVLFLEMFSEKRGGKAFLGADFYFFLIDCAVSGRFDARLMPV